MICVFLLCAKVKFWVLFGYFSNGCHDIVPHIRTPSAPLPPLPRHTIATRPHTTGCVLRLLTCVCTRINIRLCVYISPDTCINMRFAGRWGTPPNGMIYTECIFNPDRYFSYFCITKNLLYIYLYLIEYQYFTINFYL
jgi:hypothetical protein